MGKFVYIKRSIAKHYVIFEKPLKASEYNNLGMTWMDYANNKWVLLTDAQVAFHENNPMASVKEVWEMKISSHERTLEEAKKEKIQEIDNYDKSDAVNSFTINGQSMWLSVEEREQLASQISANEAVERENMTRWFGGVSYTFPIATWKQMLVALEVYAGDALNITEWHKSSVNALDTIEAVDAYDYTTDYPEKLSF